MMLVLSRKTGDSIQIADDIRVTVARIKGNRVMIAIDAPRNVSVVRSELIGSPDSLHSQSFNEA